MIASIKYELLKSLMKYCYITKVL